MIRRGITCNMARKTKLDKCILCTSKSLFRWFDLVVESERSVVTIALLRIAVTVYFCG